MVAKVATGSCCGDTRVYTVMLTGSTGSLGSYLLDNLVQNPRVKRIYCLNRSNNGCSKQYRDSACRGLPTEWDRDRVIFLQADLSRADFGLGGKVQRELLERVTHIIHNQWPVNFNWTITSFEPVIRGVRNLLDFCLAAGPARIIDLLFVSTLGTVSQVKKPGPVRERVHHDLVAELGGYGGSKLVAELIIDEYIKQYPEQRAIVCRLDQVAGPVMRQDGIWNSREWVPSIIASSKKLGLLPADLGTMSTLSWIPVDLASVIITEMALSETPPLQCESLLGNDADLSPDSSSKSHASVYHVSNPHTTEWSELVVTVAMSLGIAGDKIVPWTTWVNALRQCEPGLTRGGAHQVQSNGGVAEEETRVVGLKLIDWYDSLRRDRNTTMPAVETMRSVSVSSTLASLQPVGPAWMELWLKQWAL